MERIDKNFLIYEFSKTLMLMANKILIMLALVNLQFRSSLNMYFIQKIGYLYLVFGQNYVIY